MEKWREDAQPEQPASKTDPVETDPVEDDQVEGDRSASGGSAAGHGTWFSRDVPGRTGGANDVAAARTASRAADPDDRAGLEDRVAPDDTKATSTTMNTTPPPGGTSKVPAPGVTSGMPAQRGPEWAHREKRAQRATPTHPVASEGPEGPEGRADPEETRGLRIRPRTTPASSSAGSTGFTARLSAQVPATPRPPRTSLRDPWQEGAETSVLPPAASGPTLPVPATTGPTRTLSAVGTDTDTDTNAGAAVSTAAGADATEHTHDPHEVTIQLDAVRFGDGVLRAMPGKHRSGAGPDVADGPVFVDESGRRSRLYRRIGLAVGLACAAYAVVIVATLLSGNSNAPWVPVPGQEQELPAGKVETSPRPTEPDASPGSSTDPAPGTGPTAEDAGTGTLPSPGADLPAGGAPVAEGGAGETTAPAATPERTAPGPGTGAGAGGSTTTTAPAEPPAASAPADPTAPPGGTGTDPADSPAGEEPVAEEPAGADDLAHAPAEAPAVAAEPPAAQSHPSTAPTAPSPEHVL
ncbi:hypothetical protein [Streptomyces prasinus]|uniref:hypothetical protein n=1 Tax=Streptomyces prasinus TaxID=67345 RepID=UPI0033E1EF3B